MVTSSGDWPPVLAVVIPTFNERDNVAELVHRLGRALTGIAWEAIFVDDDSTDGTAHELCRIARTDPRVRCIQRIGRRGLASAVTEGMMSTTAPFIAVLDADLQHDESLLPEMFRVLSSSDTDVVIGSRLVDGGDNLNLGTWRRRISEFSSRLARFVLGIEVRDLMSGFFMLRREVIEQSVRKLSGGGFKVLLDIIASSPRKLSLVELPYRFRPRKAGESKLDSNAAAALLMTLVEKKLGRFLPSRLVSFLFVGGAGVLVHFAVLLLGFRLLELEFVYAQSIATLVAMTFNFAVNNLLTYRDVRLHGWGWFRGWVSFVLVCSFGAVANVGIASAMFQGDFSWGLSALAGILVGTAWNFGATKIFTWRVR